MQAMHIGESLILLYQSLIIAKTGVRINLDMWDSVVSIATSYRLDDQGVGVRVPIGPRIFSSPNRPDRL
jgi:hypothetical protein